MPMPVDDKQPTVRILHVDDDVTSLEVTKRILEDERSYVVDCALSVDEALEKLEQHDYAAIISDYRMPGKNGLDFLKELCIRGNTVPFILFTCHDNEEIADKVLNLGAFRYFNKRGDPATVYSELISCIREAVNEHKVHAQITKSNCKELSATLQIKQHEGENAPASSHFNVDFVALPFTRLKNICRFEKNNCCSETKNRCNFQHCPQIHKQ